MLANRIVDIFFHVISVRLVYRLVLCLPVGGEKNIVGSFFNLLFFCACFVLLCLSCHHVVLLVLSCGLSYVCCSLRSLRLVCRFVGRAVVRAVFALLMLSFRVSSRMSSRWSCRLSCRACLLCFVAYAVSCFVLCLPY